MTDSRSQQVPAPVTNDRRRVSMAPMTDADSDEALMLRYCAGDARAFEALYSRHKGPLYRYLLRQLQHTALAEEVFQDVWMRIVNARGTYEPRASFRTFLYHLAHNRLIDHYRRSGRAFEVDDDCPDSTTAARDWQPEVRVNSEQAVAVLLEQIAALPASQREAFLLKEEGGLSVGEIATATRVNRETAKSRLRYALQRLRAGLGDLL